MSVQLLALFKDATAGLSLSTRRSVRDAFLWLSYASMISNCIATFTCLILLDALGEMAFRSYMLPHLVEEERCVTITDENALLSRYQAGKSWLWMRWQCKSSNAPVTRTSHILRSCRALLLHYGDNHHHASNPDVYLVFGICGSASFAHDFCDVASPSHPVIYHAKIPSLHRWSLIISLPYFIAYAVTNDIITVITICLPSIRETYHNEFPMDRYAEGGCPPRDILNTFHPGDRDP